MTGIRGVLGSALGHLPPILDEGLIILAWLALWRPAEALIHGWVPCYRNRRLFDRRAGMRVSVRVSTPAAEGSHHPTVHLPGEQPRTDQQTTAIAYPGE